MAGNGHARDAIRPQAQQVASRPRMMHHQERHRPRADLQGDGHWLYRRFAFNFAFKYPVKNHGGLCGVSGFILLRMFSRKTAGM
jgi:hypothetical protein